MAVMESTVSKYDEFDESDDSLLARKTHTITQLSVAFGFDETLALQAVEAVGPDVTACYNYILDQGLGTDQGGPVVPIDTCPHIKNHVVIGVEELPIRPQNTICSHYASDNDASCSSSKSNSISNKVPAMAGLKADLGPDGTCPKGENWICLECGAIRCGRYVNGHCLAHWQACGEGEDHCIAASLADLSVWCYACNSYIRNAEFVDPIIGALTELKFADEIPERKKARSTEHSDAGVGENETIPWNLSKDDDKGNSEGLTITAEKLEGIDIENLSEEDLRKLIAAAAAARGIPLQQWLEQQVSSEESDETPFVEYPFEKPPSSLEDVARFMQSDACRSILILAGAGMSVSSGIPDFRSADGLYATINPDLLTASSVERAAMKEDPTLALDQMLFLRNPLPLLELNRDFILGTEAARWKATIAHRFVELLHVKTSKLTRLYTQNIDGLEDQCSRLPREKVIAVHGSMDCAECARCLQSSDFSLFCEQVRTHIKDISGTDLNAPGRSTPIQCPTCGQGAMKPAIVLFRSSLPAHFLQQLPRDLTNVDLLLIIGTSLRVAPANGLVSRVPRSAMRVLVNREEVGEHLGLEFGPDSRRDYFAEGDCDAIFLQLMNILGWTNELVPLLDEGKLPPSNAELLRTFLAHDRATGTYPSPSERESFS